MKVEVKATREGAKTCYTVSEDYSTSIFQKRNIFLKKEKILDTMATYIREDFYGDYEHVHFKINKKEIVYYLFDRKYTWASFGMEDLPDDFSCFCMADALAEYIVKKTCDKVDFYNTEVYWNKGARHNKKYTAEVVLSYKHATKYTPGLEKWE